MNAADMTDYFVGRVEGSARQRRRDEDIFIQGMRAAIAIQVTLGLVHYINYQESHNALRTVLPDGIWTTDQLLAYDDYYMLALETVIKART